ncbi:hypothetical protein JRY02_20840 [Enterobacter roggenkampii]|nr:hypothetical protein [Enterobacter roggenkampii]
MTFRNILLLSTIITAFFMITLSVNYNNTTLAGKTCTGKIEYRLKSTADDSRYIIEHNVKFGTETEGYDNIRGHFFKESKQYNISRTLQFKLTVNESNTLLQYRIESIHKFSDDTMPDALTNKYMTFLAENVSRIINIQELGHSLLLISDTGGPSFICNY